MSLEAAQAIFVVAFMMLVPARGALACRSSEASTLLRIISDVEETCSRSQEGYFVMAENPPQIPAAVSRGPMHLDMRVTGWNQFPKNFKMEERQVQYQYRVIAGGFDKAGKEITGGPRGLFSYVATFSPGIGYCRNKLGSLSAKNLGIPRKPNSSWFFAYAVGDVNHDGICALAIRGSGLKGTLTPTPDEDEGFEAAKKYYFLFGLLALSILVKNIRLRSRSAEGNVQLRKFQRMTSWIHRLGALLLFCSFLWDSLVEMTAMGGCSTPGFYSNLFTYGLAGLLVFSLLSSFLGYRGSSSRQAPTI